MISVVFWTLLLGILERVGAPRFLAIPYIVASVSGSKELSPKYVGVIFASGLLFDLIWQSRLGVGSFLFILCLILLDQIKLKFGNQTLWFSGLISILISVVYFAINDWPIVWWQMLMVYVFTMIFGKLMSGERGSRGEVFLRRS